MLWWNDRKSYSRLVSALLHLVNSLKAGSLPLPLPHHPIIMSRFRGFNSMKCLLSFKYNLNYFLVALKNMREV